MDDTGAAESTPNVDTGRCVRHGLGLAAGATLGASVALWAGILLFMFCSNPFVPGAPEVAILYIAVTWAIAILPALGGGAVLALDLRRQPPTGLQRAGKRKGAIIGVFVGAQAGFCRRC